MIRPVRRDAAAMAIEVDQSVQDGPYAKMRERLLQDGKSSSTRLEADSRRSDYSNKLAERGHTEALRESSGRFGGNLPKMCEVKQCAELVGKKKALAAIVHPLCVVQVAAAISRIRPVSSHCGPAVTLIHVLPA